MSDMSPKSDAFAPTKPDHAGRTSCRLSRFPLVPLSCGAGLLFRRHTPVRRIVTVMRDGCEQCRVKFSGQLDSGNRLLRYSAARLPIPLARSETFARLCVLAVLLLLGQARVVISHTLLLRPLRRGAPLVVFRPVAGKAWWS